MVQDVNFWGSVCPIYFAMPSLKRTKGSIFVNASASSHLNPPGISIYAVRNINALNASKAALLSIYETMRAELAPEISITTATLGVIEPEMSKGKYLNREGITQTFINQLPVMSASASACAKSIVDAICRKERYVTEPKWWRVFFLLKTFCPELIEFANHTYSLQMKACLPEQTPCGQNLSSGEYLGFKAMPYLKRTKGSISVNASASAYMHPSGFSIYTASKAALVSFYETMRSEMPPEISITTATLSLVESEMTKGKHLNREGTTEVSPELADTLINQLPAMSTSACAKSIVEAVCRKERYVTEPEWCAVLFLLKAPCPGLIEFVNCRLHLRVKASVAKNFSMPPPENRSA
nr:uncharacterized protein LOC113692987 [Coffea arabica]